MLLAINTISFETRIDERGRSVEGAFINQGNRFEAPNEATRAALIADGVAIDESEPEARVIAKRIADRQDEEHRRREVKFSRLRHRK